MEFNKSQDHSNSPDKDISGKKVNKFVLFLVGIKTFFAYQSSFNYERFQAGGWLNAMLPVLKRTTKTKKEFAERSKPHLDFINTNPPLAFTMLGISAAMEEQKQDLSQIRAIRVALMGPFGGIGDSIMWFTLLPITAGIGASLAKEGNIVGPILFFVLFNAVGLFVRFGGLYLGYNVGIKALDKIKAGMENITRFSTIIGVMVAGGLIASFVDFETTLSLSIGDDEIKIQEELFDEIMPNFLPLAFTFLMYWLVKKGISPIVLIAITIVIGLVGKVSGIF